MVLFGAVYLHAVFAVEPAADVYVPPVTDTPVRALHALQSAAALPPVALRYVPAAQLVRFVPPVQYLPAGHAAQLDWPAADVYVPAAQVVQDVAVSPALTVPAAHWLHVASLVLLPLIMEPALAVTL